MLSTILSRTKLYKYFVFTYFYTFQIFYEKPFSPKIIGHLCVCVYVCVCVCVCEIFAFVVVLILTCIRGCHWMLALRPGTDATPGPAMDVSSPTRD